MNRTSRLSHSKYSVSRVDLTETFPLCRAQPSVVTGGQGCWESPVSFILLYKHGSSEDCARVVWMVAHMLGE